MAMALSRVCRACADHRQRRRGRGPDPDPPGFVAALLPWGRPRHQIGCVFKGNESSCDRVEFRPSPFAGVARGEALPEVLGRVATEGSSRLRKARAQVHPAPEKWQPTVTQVAPGIYSSDPVKLLEAEAVHLGGYWNAQ
eukprot:4631724-Pyramimonas_sp.AAC.1